PFHLLFVLMLLLSPGSTLFPYTTLFRSCWNVGISEGFSKINCTQYVCPSCGESNNFKNLACAGSVFNQLSFNHLIKISCRSLSKIGKHTSELQSRENLVCRLLLEKKKTN